MKELLSYSELLGEYTSHEMSVFHEEPDHEDDENTKKGAIVQTDSPVSTSAAPMMMIPSSSTTTLQHLDNDSLALILEYAGILSVQLFHTSLSQAWAHRMHHQLVPLVAKRLYARQGFSTENVVKTNTTKNLCHHHRDDPYSAESRSIWREGHHRRRLERAWIGRNTTKHTTSHHKKRRSTNSLSLPDRCFGFVPVLPDDWEVNSYAYNDDAPPVHFDCDSFWLTSSGTSGELLFLNPFSTRVSVWDERMILQQQKSPQSSSSSSLVTKPRPKQILFDTADYFNIDLKEYFPHLWNNHTNRHHHHQQQQQRMMNRMMIMDDDTNNSDDDDDDEQEFDVSYIGVEAKPVWNTARDDASDASWRTSHGTMAAVGRILSATEDSFHHGHHNNNNHMMMEQDEDQDAAWKVTEIIAWFRKNSDESQLYANRHRCRFRGGFFHMDVCATQKLVYVNPWKETTTAGEGGWVLDGDLGRPPAGANRVVVYPLVPEQQHSQPKEATLSSTTATGNDASPMKEKTTTNYFPKPLAYLSCREQVTALKVSPEGTTVVVATVRGQVQVWNMSQPSAPIRMASISCTKALQTAYENSGRVFLPVEEMESTNAMNDGVPNNQHAAQASIHHPSPIEDIFVSRHLTVEQAGFVSLQYHPRHGSTLLLWKLDGHHSRSWSIRAKVNLPLTASRFPKVHFDGRKIVVLGQDHIGYMILVYKVLYSNDDVSLVDNANTMPVTKLGEEGSGSVTNFGWSTSCPSATTPPAIYFAGCIRHARLGGFQSYDPLYMTCNERFVIVSTKSAHHTGGSLQFLEDLDDSMVYSYSEGLLVIDLEKVDKKDAGFSFSK